MKKRKPAEGLRHALDGIAHVFRTQRYMRFHFLAVLFVMLIGLWLHFEISELILLFFAMFFVLFAEMINTAIEAAFDMLTTTYHPMAKMAKDVSAGAVLLATLNAIFVWVLLFMKEGRLRELFRRQDIMGADYVTLTIVGVVLILIFIVTWKGRGGRGSLMRGGAISGHAAIAFFIGTVIFYVAQSRLAAFLGFLLAVVVAQSRVEAKIHSFQEVAFGALFGTIMGTVILYVLFPMPR